MADHLTLCSEARLRELLKIELEVPQLRAELNGTTRALDNVKAQRDQAVRTSTGLELSYLNACKKIEGLKAQLAESQRAVTGLQTSYLNACKEIARLKVWSSDSHVTQLGAKLAVARKALGLIGRSRLKDGGDHAAAMLAREVLAQLDATTNSKQDKLRQGVSDTTLPIWQCSGCQHAERFSYHDLPKPCPKCGKRNYWCGSVAPEVVEKVDAEKVCPNANGVHYWNALKSAPNDEFCEHCDATRAVTGSGRADG